MNILYVMIPLSLVLVVFAGWAFFWAVGSGQFDDLESPAWEVLREPSEAQADAQIDASNVSSDVMAAAPSAGEPPAETSAGPPRNVPGPPPAGVRLTARSG
jgi:cbb3-type cytochrome oxidase maturation protein